MKKYFTKHLKSVFCIMDIWGEQFTVIFLYSQGIQQAPGHHGPWLVFWGAPTCSLALRVIHGVQKPCAPFGLSSCVVSVYVFIDLSSVSVYVNGLQMLSVKNSSNSGTFRTCLCGVGMALKPIFSTQTILPSAFPWLFRESCVVGGKRNVNLDFKATD